MIDAFRGEYFFLSNFYTTPVVYEGLEYTNSEAAFQSAKSTDQKVREQFATLAPNEAKRLGRSIDLRPDWEDVKTGIMKDILRDKFTRNKTLAIRLLNTNNEYLEEGNTWGDTYWGTVDGEGMNTLGKLLMEIRSELRDDVISSQFSLGGNHEST